MLPLSGGADPQPPPLRCCALRLPCVAPGAARARVLAALSVWVLVPAARSAPASLRSLLRVRLDVPGSAWEVGASRPRIFREPAKWFVAKITGCRAWWLIL